MPGFFLFFSSLSLEHKQTSKQLTLTQDYKCVCEWSNKSMRELCVTQKVTHYLLVMNFVLREVTKKRTSKRGRVREREREREQ